MIKQPSQETEQALAELVKAVGGDGSYHFAPVYVCDHCKNEDKEAFPYGVYDREGCYWSDLCNDCFDKLGCSYPADNWDYRLKVEIYSDDPEEIAKLLREIARRVKRGETGGAESYCAGTYEFTLEETPAPVEDEE